MRKDAFSLVIHVNGKPVTEYPHEGHTFVEGRKGSDFEVEFVNHTAARVLMVPSVDGVSCLNGQPAGPDSPGYVVPGYGRVVIPGWTLDTGSVARFVFADKERGYAQYATGSDTHSGVVGALVFAENLPQPTINTVWKHTFIPTPAWQQPPMFGNTIGTPVYSSTVTNSPDYLDNSAVTRSMTSKSTTASVDDFQMGTGWGSKQDFSTRGVTFDKGVLMDQLVLYYDSRRNLERRGIVMTRNSTTRALPQAFPTIGCTPPKGWTG